MNRLKRIVAIHDISCFGKCSLTVALPIISAAGIETSIIPTAVLSTHTGGFTGFTYKDLTDEILPIVEHWKKIDLKFDAIYTGFLGSSMQIDIISKVFDMLRTPENIIIVDPVMADNGELYKIFPKDFPKGMKKLCMKADIIIPNITEAVLMLEEPYKEGPYSHEYIEDILRKLCNLGPKKAVLTGVYFDSFNLGAAAYDSTTQKFSYAFSSRIEGYYHGTGDVFASALTAALLRGRTIADSIKIAVDFTSKSIQRTFEAKTDIRFGVNFEEGFEQLIKDLN